MSKPVIPVAIDMNTGQVHYQSDGPIPSGWQRIAGLQGHLIHAVQASATEREYRVEETGQRVLIRGRCDCPTASVWIEAVEEKPRLEEPAPGQEPETPHDPAPIPDFSSDEAASRTRQAFKEWHGRGN